MQTKILNLSLCIRLLKLFILICCISSRTFALPINQGHIELFGEAGLAQLSTKNTIVHATTIETDSLQQKNNPFTASLLGIGIGYTFPLHSKSNGMNWFPYLKPIANLRYQKLNAEGQVYQFQDPEFYNYDYTISVASTRLMFDLALGFFKYKHFSAYVLGGIGETWNQISYHDQSIPGVSGGSLFLNKSVNSKFIPETGVGVSYGINEKLTLSLEYLYTNFGTNYTSANGTLNGSLTSIPPIRVPITSQSVQLIAAWKI